MHIHVFGSNSFLSEFLNSSIHGDDSFSECQKSPLDLTFTHGDILILVSAGMTLIRKLYEHITAEIPVILITDEYEWFEFINFPFLKVINPPFSSFMLHKCLDECRSVISEFRNLEKHVAGKSSDACRLRADIIMASRTAIPVHISGESGTGKTHAAKLIHLLGRQKRNLVYVNCANLSSSIADSDLFGHSKGAFTGAHSTRNGLLKEADGSTLFLDEIGNLPLEEQAKLLDTIESGRYRSVGCDGENTSSFRLITAAHRSLEELLEEKKLREDFYYRISSLTFSIKPLREHKEDIPHIVRHYERMKKIENSTIRNFSPLMKPDWKGNIRQLLHFLDRIYVTHHGISE